MNYEIKAFSVNSTDNIHTLEGKIYIPVGEIKGLFHIVHGMTEYIDRYDNLMSQIAENGYVCFGFDNLGHGKTVNNEDELGFIAHNDGWKYLVNDVYTFSDAVKKMYPDKPLILMGHSMGSFIARLTAEYYPESYEKLIICGTGGPNPLSLIGLILAKIIKFIKGEKHISKTIYKLAFGNYNNTFEGLSEYDWLTSDREIIKKYQNDKFCTFKFTVSAIIDLLTLLKNSNSKKWFKNISKTMPILLIAGECDPVGNYGKGVKKVFEMLKNENANAKLILYPNARHEIHNDYCKETVLNDILNFIEKEPLV